MGLFDKASSWLAGKLQQAAEPGDDVARTLYYVRAVDGSQTDLTGLAWVGRTVFSRRDPVGQRGPAIEYGDRDYLVPVANLPFEPARGDRLVETSGGVALAFEIVTPAGEPAWRYSDPQRTIYRVHTKEVS